MGKINCFEVSKIVFVLLAVLIGGSANAGWVNSPPGTVSYVRTYAVGVDGLRTQIGVSGATHGCGSEATIYYFDSDKIPMTVVKAVLSLLTTAMISGKSVVITYDCSISGGGFGWGTAVQVLN